MTDEGDSAVNYEQTVTTISGFSYGTIGASIHVFGNGVPVYLLLNWHAETSMNADWLRRMPSRMLNARFAVVPFTGRADALAELLQWRDDPASLFAVRMLHAEGGSGKTRLAAKLAGDSAAAGWKVVTAIPGPGTVLPPPGSHDLRTDGFLGLLLLVDYADQWPWKHLTWLLSNELLSKPGLRVRVLLVARTAGGLPQLRAALAGRQIEVSAQKLRGLRAPAAPHDPAGDANSRLETFSAARLAFAERYGIADAETVAPPVPLEAPGMALTLAVHMAALVAVDARSTGQSPPGDLSGLSLYLLDREHLRWQQMHGDGTYEMAPAERTYRTPAEVMHRTVFAATLTGRLPRENAALLLSEIGVVPANAGPSAGEQVLADHSVCYPPDGGTGAGTVFEPLYPDRLAEDFLALSLPGHSADYPAQPWAADILRVLLRRGEDGQPPRWWVSRTLGFLTAAALRWDHVGTRHLYPLLRREPQLAITGGSTVLSGLAALPDVPPALLAAIREQFNRTSHADLQAGAADVVERLAPYDLRRSLTAASRAEVLGVLSSYLSAAGRYGDSAAALGEAVAITRRLATPNALTRFSRRLTSTDTRIIQVRLAKWLINQAGDLNAADEPDKAIAAAEESISILKELSGDDSQMYVVEMATALGALGSAYSRLGRDTEALAVAREIVELRREQGRHWPFHIYPWMANLPGNGNSPENIRFARWVADPGGHERGLSKALIGLGVRQSIVGDYQGAEASLREALGILLPLADAAGSRYEVEVAEALDNYGKVLASIGMFTGAEIAAQEAVGRIRQLARQNSSLYGPFLAHALSGLSQRLWKLGQLDSAIAAAEEGFGLSQEFTATATDAAGAAMELAELAALYSAAGQHSRALSTADEAVARVRALDGRLPAIDLNDYLSGALSKLGAVAYSAGDHERAQAADAEAVTIELASQSTDTGGRALVARFNYAIALSNQSSSLARLQHLDEAHESAAHAIDIFRSLAAEQPMTYQPDLARTLANSVGLFVDLGYLDEALAAATESASIYRDLAAAQASAHEAGLARALDTLDTALHALDRDAEALAALAESAEIYRRLTNAQPGVHELSLIRVLKYAGRRHRVLRQYEESLAATHEAIYRCRDLAVTRPLACREELADTLSDLGILLAGMGQPEPALTATEESVAVYRELLSASPGLLSSFAAELNRLAARQRALSQHDEALSTTTEALAQYRELVARVPPDHLGDRADALDALSVLALELGHAEESLTTMEEAVSILRRLAETNPVSREPDLARILGNLASPLVKLGRKMDAYTATLESMALYQRLAVRKSAAIDSRAATVSENLQALHVALVTEGALPADG